MLSPLILILTPVVLTSRTVFYSLMTEDYASSTSICFMLN